MSNPPVKPEKTREIYHYYSDDFRSVWGDAPYGIMSALTLGLEVQVLLVGSVHDVTTNFPKEVKERAQKIADAFKGHEGIQIDYGFDKEAQTISVCVSGSNTILQFVTCFNLHSVKVSSVKDKLPQMH